MNEFGTQVAFSDAAINTFEFAINWLLQSSLLLTIGLVTGRLLRQWGSAVQSVIYRTTMIAVFICPLATWVLSQAGVSGWSVELPHAWIQRQPRVEIATSATHIHDSAAERTDSTVMPSTADENMPSGVHSLTDDAGFRERTVFGADSSREHLQAAGAGQTMETRSAAASRPTSQSDASVLTSSSRRVFGWVAMAMVASWFLISLALSVRLAVAWRQLARLRRRAVSADEGTIHACRDLASMLNVSAPEVLRSPCLPSPCLAGLRRPAVLLPEVDHGLSLRDVLVHELAHLRRHDCHWNLLRQIATAAFFFQPLLWKLSRRLEATAEEVCDDYVVQLGGDRHEYAHRLVDIAELSSVPMAAAGVGIVSLRSMLGQRVSRIMDTSRTLSTRVGNLLLVAVIVCGFVGTTVTGLVGLGSPPSETELKARVVDDDRGTIDIAIEERLEPVRSDTAAATPTDASVDSKDTKTVADATPSPSILYEGKVVDPLGRPVDGAKLFLVFHIPQPTGLLSPVWKPLTHTDADGEFRFSASPTDFGVGATAREFGYSMLVAVKDGYGFAWSPAGMHEKEGTWLRKFRARLKEMPADAFERAKQMLSGVGKPLKLVADDQPIHGRIVDIDGRPVAGATLTLLRIWSGADDGLTAWNKATQKDKADFYSARMKTPKSMNGPQVRSFVEPAVTDAEGRFTLRGVGRGRIAQLLVEGPRIESAKIFARTEKGAKIKLLRARRSPDLGSYIYHPADLTLVAGPTTAITGIIRDRETREPLSGVTVKSQSRQGEPISGWGQDFVRAVTDQDGRYRLEGMPIGKDNRIAAIAPAGDVAYVSLSKRAATTGQEDPLEIDFDLLRGVWIEGRVTDKQTGKGLSGRLKYFAKKGNPNLESVRSLGIDERDRLKSDDNGNFRIAALAGPGYVTFMADEHQNYPRATAILKRDGRWEEVSLQMLYTGQLILTPQNYHLVAEIDPAPKTKRVELNLELDGSTCLSGRAVGPDGQPVVDFYYSGQIAQFATWMPSSGGKFELKGYDPESPRHVYVASRTQDLAGYLVVDGERSEDLVVKLETAGKVTGRLVDEDGAPLANCPLVALPPPISSPADLMPAHHSPPLPHNTASSTVGQYETDDEGRFEISCLVPRVEYRVLAFDRASIAPARGRVPRISGPLDVVITVEPGESKDLGDVRLADQATFWSTSPAR